MVEFTDDEKKELSQSSIVFADADVFAHWAKYSRWKPFQAASLLLGIEEREFEKFKKKGSVSLSNTSGIDKLRQAVDRTAGLILSHTQTHNGNPAKLVEWADQYEIPVPDQLRAMVGKFGSIHMQRVGEPIVDETRADKNEPKLEDAEPSIKNKITWLKSEITSVLKEYPNERKYSNEEFFELLLSKYSEENPSLPDDSLINKTQFRTARQEALSRASTEVVNVWSKAGRSKG